MKHCIYDDPHSTRTLYSSTQPTLLWKEGLTRPFSGNLSQRGSYFDSSEQGQYTTMKLPTLSRSMNDSYSLIFLSRLSCVRAACVRCIVSCHYQIRGMSLCRIRARATVSSTYSANHLKTLLSIPQRRQGKADGAPKGGSR